MRALQTRDITLSSEECSEIISRLTGILKVPAERLSLFKVWSPLFFSEETLLFKVADSKHGQRYPAYLGHYARTEEGNKVDVINDTGSLGIDVFIDFFAQHPDQLILDKTTVLDYVRFFLSTWCDVFGHTLIEDTADFFWYSELLPEEQKTIAAALDANPLETDSDTSRNCFEVRACVLQDDKLKRISFFVNTASAAQSLGVSSTVQGKGAINFVAGNEQLLLAGLPDNYMLAPDHWAAVFAEDTAPEKRCDWSYLSHTKEIYAILQDVFRQLEPVPAPEHCTLRRKYLPFYRQYLYEIGFPYNGAYRVVPVIWSPGNIHVLNYDTDSVLQLNELFSDQLHSALKDEFSVLEYVRFIGEYRWGDDGPALPVEDRQHARFAAVDHGAIETPDDVSVDEAWARIKPMQIHQENDGWVVEYCEWVGYEVLRLEMRVKANGDVSADRYKLVMAFPVPEGGSLFPHARLELVPNSISLKQQQQNRATLIHCDAASLTEEIIAAPDKGKLTIANHVVSGCLDLEGINVAVGLIFQNCRFRGPVNMSSMECSSNLNIMDCVFENGLTLAHANIKHALKISNTIFLSGLNSGSSLEITRLSAQSVEITRTNCQRGLHANGLSVNGDVDISEYTAYGDFSMRESAIEGVLTLSSKTRAFYVRGSGDIEYMKARSAFLQGVTFDGLLTMDYGSVDQYLAFEATETEHNTWPVRIGHWSGDDDSLGLSIYGTVIEHNFLAFKGIDIAGNLNAGFIRAGTGIFVETPDVAGLGNRIGGTFLLKDAVAPQVLNIQGCRIGGDLDARGIQTGRVNIREVSLNRDDKPSVLNEPVEVGGCILFSEAVITGDALLAGITTNTKNTDTTYSLELRRASIRGNLSLYASAQKMNSDRPSKALIPRGINLRKADIGGDLDLSHINAAEGEVDLTDAVIGRDVDLKPCSSNQPAKMARLNMEGMRCEGSADLSGLILLSKTTREDIPGQGSVHARGITVGGTLAIHKEGTSAFIPGKLDLNSSKLGELSISFRYFKYSCDNKSLETSGIHLNKATIEKLSVAVDEGFPCPIDLRFADIKWWEFHRSGGTTCENADDYIALLDKDPNKQQHTWRAVENSLYERGYEDAADSVHKAMRHWVRETEKQEARNSNSILRKAWIYSRLLPRMPLDFFTEFGTTTWRLVIAMVLWFTLSVHLFSISDNIAPSEEGLAATNTSLTNSDHPARWSSWDGFWLAIRFHVPVILFTARDEWEPTNGNKLVIYQGAAGKPMHFPFGDPEEYANLVIIFHWLAWPIILITASRKLFRRPGNT